MRGQGRGPVPGVKVAEGSTRAGAVAPSGRYEGLDLASMIDPCVRYSAVRDATGRVNDLRYEALNEAAVAYNGMSREDTIGRTLLELFPGHLATGWFDRYVDVIETGRPLEMNEVSYTLERSDGRERQYEIRALPAENGMVLTWRDVTARYTTARAIADSEERFRLLAENTTDVVLEVDFAGVTRWASPSAEAVLGRAPHEFLGESLTTLAADEDSAHMLRQLALTAEQGTSRGECRLRTTGSDVRWVDVRMHVRNDSVEHAPGLVVGFRDIHREVLARRARDTLSAANAAMVRSRSVAELLAAMCDVPLTAGGYRMALYARLAPDGTAAVEAFGSMGPGVIDPATLPIPLPTRVPADITIRTGRVNVFHDLFDPSFDEGFIERARKGDVHSCVGLPVFVDGQLDGAFTVFAAEKNAFDGEAIQVLEDLVAQIGAGLERLRTAEHLSRALEDYSLLMTAVDQAADSIVVTDTDAKILYANPATCAASGYTAEELVGQNPRMFQSGFHDAAFYSGMWAQLVDGHPFHGVMVNRRKSGEIYEEDATITPVRDDTGAIVAYVGVKHDLTSQRLAEAELNRHRVDREMALEIMRDVSPADTLEATANALAMAVGRLPNFDGCVVLMLGPAGEVIPVGGTASDVPGFELPLGVPLPILARDGFIEALRRGTWWIDLTDQDGPAGLFPDISRPMAAAGFVLSAYAPIRWEGELVGAISITSCAPDARSWIDERLPVLEEIGTFAGMLFGAHAQAYGDAQALRTLVRNVIDEQRFHMVMQPVVHLTTGAVVGYEALTRFDDGTPPNVRFSQAHTLGLGGELEGACARQALRDAVSLPAGVWLSLNFSPAAIVDGTASLTIAGAGDRLVVVEITEHLAIDNYPTLNSALAELGGARLAVDDAGAGFASLRHILELKPHFVKLDLELVRSIDDDPARQALAAGLRHFCSQSGITMIAEGVETEAEARMLAELGVDLAQGYYYGRPAPVAASSASAG